VAAFRNLSLIVRQSDPESPHRFSRSAGAESRHVVLQAGANKVAQNEQTEIV
jgi:hypothetical protein